MQCRKKVSIKENRIGREIWKVASSVLGSCGTTSSSLLPHNVWARSWKCNLSELRKFSYCWQFKCWGWMAPERSVSLKQELTWGDLVVQEVSLENQLSPFQPCIRWMDSGGFPGGQAAGKHPASLCSWQWFTFLDVPYKQSLLQLVQSFSPRFVAVWGCTAQSWGLFGFGLCLAGPAVFSIMFSVLEVSAAIFGDSVWIGT